MCLCGGLALGFFYQHRHFVAAATPSPPFVSFVCLLWGMLLRLQIGTCSQIAVSQGSATLPASCKLCLPFVAVFLWLRPCTRSPHKPALCTLQAKRLPQQSQVDQVPIPTAGELKKLDPAKQQAEVSHQAVL